MTNGQKFSYFFVAVTGAVLFWLSGWSLFVLLGLGGAVLFVAGIFPDRNDHRNGWAQLIGVLMIGAAIFGYLGYGGQIYFTPAPTEAPVAPLRENEPAPESGAGTEAAALPETGGQPTNYVDQLTLDAQRDTGINLQRYSTNEPAMWVWRGAPLFDTNKKCTGGYTCTADAEVDGLRFIAVWKGGPDVKFDKVYGITVRHNAEYPADDPLNADICAFLANENVNGQKENPSFNVLAGNFSCANASATVKSFLPGNGTNLACPTTAKDVSVLLTGTTNTSSNFEKRDGYWYYKAGGPAVKMTLPFGRLLGWNGSNIDITKIGESAENVTEATFYCTR